MKQLHIPGTSSDQTMQKTEQQIHHWQLFIDGASRNNPGLAGAGIYLEKDGASVVQESCFLGIKTNNQAEYLALLFGLFFLKQHMGPDDTVYIISDSELLVRQMLGIYKVKNPILKPFYTLALSLLKPVHYTIKHVVRAQNVKADTLANRGVDQKKPLPPAFKRMLSQHEILL